MRAGTVEFVVGAGFLLGPLVYALTLQGPASETCESSLPASVTVETVSVEPTAAEPPVVKEPVPVVEAEVEEPAPRVDGAFWFVVGESRFVVLATDVDASWGRGKLFEPEGDGEGDERVAKRVDDAEIPAALLARRGQTIDIYDEDGLACSAKIDRLLVIAQYGWGIEGLELPFEDPETRETIEHTPERIRQAVWDTQSRWLVGEIESDCGGLWARDPALPAPMILEPSNEPSPTTLARTKEFEQNELVELRAEYEEFRVENADAEEPPEDWDTAMGDGAPSIRTWLDPAGVARFLELDYGSDDGMCSNGFNSEVRAFEAVSDGAFHPAAHPIDVEAIFDLDLDGRFEVLDFDDSYDARGFSWSLDSETEGLSSTLRIEQDFGGCPC